MSEKFAYAVFEKSGKCNAICLAETPDDFRWAADKIMKGYEVKLLPSDEAKELFCAKETRS